MAISIIEYKLLNDIRRAGFIKPQPRMLEFGESNWYAQLPVDALYPLIEAALITDGQKKEFRHAVDVADLNDPLISFHLAKLFFKILFDYVSYTAVDMGGTETAHKFDLNHPIPLDGQFDLVLNLGTSEHIFNTCQFFKTMHEQCAPGGAMIHGVPFCGWYDHGFYNYQPTFFWDLAAANDYRIAAFGYAEQTPLRILPIPSRESVMELAKAKQFGEYALLYVALVKAAEESDFRIPMQGYYAGTLSASLQTDWQQVRGNAA